MRRVLIIAGGLILLLIAAGCAWIFAGPQIALFADRFGASKGRSEQIHSVRYEGNGAGGILYVNQVGLSLNEIVPPLPPPSIGSTKDGQLALASGGKVFAFGPLPTPTDETGESLATSPPPGDDARLISRHSALSWPTPLDSNFMTGSAPSWKRYQYQELRWTKPGGAKLQMVWRYEQYFYPNQGWREGRMTRADATGLIRIDIQP